MPADDSKPQHDPSQASASARAVPSLGSTDPLAIRAQKQALRAELRARRRACAPACGSPQAAELGEQLADVLEQVISWSSVHTTAVYASVGHELDTAPLCRRLRQRSIRTCYPRVESKQPPKLSFIAVEDEQELVAAPFGLREPAAAATPLPLSAIDVFIVPGLGFDRDGQRLGQGLAFYDGILRQHPDALRVGVCHPFQQLSAVPHEPHDQGMDLVVTPTGYLVAMTRTRHRLQRVVDLKRPGVAPGLVDSETVSQPLEVKP